MHMIQKADIPKRNALRFNYCCINGDLSKAARLNGYHV